MAVANYQSREGRLPPPFIAGPDGRPWHSWRVLILPDIGQDDLYGDYHFDEPWNGPRNRRLAERMPSVYALHGDYRPGLTTTNYLAVVGPETVWQVDKAVTLEMVTANDGWSNTIVVVENRGAEVHWMEPRDLSLAEMDFTLQSPAGISSKYADPAVAMLDGSISRLTPEITPETLRALLTFNGGEHLTRGQNGWELLPDGRDRPLAGQ